MTEDHTRRLARLLGYLGALSLVGVSVAMNVQAGIAKSETLSGQITWAVASGASDILKAVSPIFLAWAIARRDIIRAGAAILVLVVTAGYSLISAISYSHGSRADLASIRESTVSAHARATAQYGDAQSRLATLPATRPALELQAAITGALVDPKAGDCNTMDGPVSRRVCPQVAEFRTELARANERQRLYGDVQSAKAQLDALRLPGPADPAAEAVAKFLGKIGFGGLEPGDAALWLSLLGVVLVEVGSSFGLLLVSGSAPAGKRERDGTTGPPLILPSSDSPRTPIARAASIAEPAGFSEASVPAIPAPSVAEPKIKRGRGRPRQRTAAIMIEKLTAYATQGQIRSTQAELARVLGVSKATAHRELKRLAASGALQLSACRSATTVSLL